MLSALGRGHGAAILQCFGRFSKLHSQTEQDQKVGLVSPGCKHLHQIQSKDRNRHFGVR